MDALALLCTLHADGPSTLKNLRQAGCGSLEAIESMEEERLSKVLGGPPAVARRFAREARHLRERLDPGMLDREETHVDPQIEAPSPTDDADDSASGARPPAFDLAARLGLSNLAPAPKAREGMPSTDPVVATDRADSSTSSGASALEVRESPVHAQRDPMADVLEAWRDRDETEARELPVAAQLEAVDAAAEEETPPRPARARPEFEFGAEIVAVMRQLASTPASPGQLASAAREPEELASATKPAGLLAPTTMPATRLVSTAPATRLAPMTAPVDPIASSTPARPGSSRPVDGPLVEGLSMLFDDQGMDLAIRLGEEGIRDLRELTDADILDLSERLGFGYTRILRVVQLARRAATPLFEPPATAFGAGVSDVREEEDLLETAEAPSELEPEPKISPADRPRALRPSILELEWNLELQPQARPPAPERFDSPAPEGRSESAGGPFA